ncbi:helix-turn-helix transcriptional regulator [Isoptericola cucumis]|uniref:Transcriptional regulator n=1 Tax=Isoptericola cucumis TaxID=1776856 RepID=A0ABQ2BD27_9MICO|nr:helix-turn-helix transcriptional regulator [Isoptericola cucumis]GGI11543.1 transcriptional regulator [Isoptericola cucumis]
MRSRVRELRSAAGLTQADLAARVAVSRRTIISIEQGRFDPSLPLAFRLARALGTRVDELFIPDDDGDQAVDVRSDEGVA